jgi:hypothetical protein
VICETIITCNEKSSTFAGLPQQPGTFPNEQGLYVIRNGEVLKEDFLSGSELHLNNSDTPGLMIHENPNMHSSQVVLAAILTYK